MSLMALISYCELALPYQAVRTFVLAMAIRRTIVWRTSGISILTKRKASGASVKSRRLKESIYSR